MRNAWNLTGKQQNYLGNDTVRRKQTTSTGQENQNHMPVRKGGEHQAEDR